MLNGKVFAVTCVECNSFQCMMKVKRSQVAPDATNFAGQRFDAEPSAYPGAYLWYCPDCNTFADVSDLTAVYGLPKSWVNVTYPCEARS